jgi:hypothetical protein
MSQQEVENQIGLLRIKKGDDGMESFSLQNDKNGVFSLFTKIEKRRA